MPIYTLTEWWPKFLDLEKVATTVILDSDKEPLTNLLKAPFLASCLADEGFLRFSETFFPPFDENPGRLWISAIYANGSVFTRGMVTSSDEKDFFTLGLPSEDTVQ